MITAHVFLLVFAAFCVVLRLLISQGSAQELRSLSRHRIVIRRSRPYPRTLVIREEDVRRYELRVLHEPSAERL